MQNNFPFQKETELMNSVYGNKVRLRVCGLLATPEAILLVHHIGLGQDGHLYSPPGGAPNFGETIQDALKREFQEETGLVIEIERFAFVNQYLNPPLHAVELFYWVKEVGGNLSLGIEPELPEHSVLMNKLAWFSFQELSSIPQTQKHNLFNFSKSFEDLLNLPFELPAQIIS